MDNDVQTKSPLKKIHEDNCNSLNINFKLEDFHYLKKDQFLNSFNLSNILNLNEKKYVIVHYDEKWEIKNYSKAFSGASSLTDIDAGVNLFIQFLTDLSEQTFGNIILTTGTINTRLINDFKNISKKLNQNVHEINLKNGKIHLLLNQDFFSISHLISNCSLFISCHGAFTHIASNYQIRILDIIEKSKFNHYNRITHHMKKYKSLYRQNFVKLSKAIINNS